MSDKGYNGFVNRETWLVVLWINNSEPLNREIDAMLVAILEESWKPSSCPMMGTTHPERAQYILTNRLKEFFSENNPLETGLYSDLLRGALDSVDWGEVATHILVSVLEDTGLVE